MIVLWFIIGILIAYGIARYNESNKLFWQLMLAFTLGYATTVMCTRTFSDGKDGKSSIQVTPTQKSTTLQSNVLYVPNCGRYECGWTKVEVTALNSVSQEYIPELHESFVVLNEVRERTRDQPLQSLVKPPEITSSWFFNTS